MYEQEQKSQWDAAAILDHKLNHAMNKGLQKGREEGKRAIEQIAQRLLKEGLPVEQIALLFAD